VIAPSESEARSIVTITDCRAPQGVGARKLTRR
jgi:hypothetical protein